MSKEPSTTTDQDVSAVKASPQFARLRVAETEETGTETSISGEELCTDGSSDEDNYCRCKNSPGKDYSAKDSSATLARLARSKGRLVGKKPASISCRRRSGEASRELACGQAASKAISPEASDEDDSLDDGEISWKANREEEVMIENEMVAIEKFRKECPEIYETVDSIFDQYFQQLMNLEQVDNEIFVEGKEKIKGDLMSSVQFLDTTMDKIMSKLEQIKKKTQQIQLQNRLRLKEILKNSPTPSAKLAENTKKFFDLYPGSCGTETVKDIVKSCLIENKF